MADRRTSRSRHPDSFALRSIHQRQDKDEKDWTHAYADDLKADVYVEVNADPKATVHSVEWRKIMNGDPVEINPSIGAGRGPHLGALDTRRVA